MNERVPPSSDLRTGASIGAFLTGAVNRLEIEDTPYELLSSCLGSRSQGPLVATMGCKKRNYFHLKTSFQTTMPVVEGEMGFFPSVEALRKEAVRSGLWHIAWG